MSGMTRKVKYVGNNDVIASGTAQIRTEKTSSIRDRHGPVKAIQGVFALSITAASATHEDGLSNAYILEASCAVSQEARQIDFFQGVSGCGLVFAG